MRARCPQPGGSSPSDENLRSAASRMPRPEPPVERWPTQEDRSVERKRVAPKPARGPSRSPANRAANRGRARSVPPGTESSKRPAGLTRSIHSERTPALPKIQSHWPCQGGSTRCLPRSQAFQCLQELGGPAVVFDHHFTYPAGSSLNNGGASVESKDGPRHPFPRPSSSAN